MRKTIPSKDPDIIGSLSAGAAPRGQCGARTGPPDRHAGVRVEKRSGREHQSRRPAETAAASAGGIVSGEKWGVAGTASPELPAHGE